MKKLILFLLCILPLNLVAETLYVGDTLRVGIRPEPVKSLPSISVVQTGAAVEVLERKRSFAKIRTKNGVEGWVKSAYLTRKVPAFQKLNRAEKKIASLEKDLAKLRKSQNNQTKQDHSKLSTKIQQLQKEKSELQNEISQLKADMSKQSNTSKVQPKVISFDLGNMTRNTVYVIIGVILGILILGFLFGVSWYKQQVTKRLGGLSI